jgi:hypothetical protein
MRYARIVTSDVCILSMTRPTSMRARCPADEVFYYSFGEGEAVLDGGREEERDFMRT